MTILKWKSNCRKLKVKGMGIEDLHGRKGKKNSFYFVGCPWQEIGRQEP